MYPFTYKKNIAKADGYGNDLLQQSCCGSSDTIYPDQAALPFDESGFSPIRQWPLYFANN